MPHIIDINPDGPGPFALPLFAEFVSVDFAAGKPYCIARFRFEDGPEVHVPIANQVAVDFAEALSFLPLVHGGSMPGVDYNPDKTN